MNRSLILFILTVCFCHKPFACLNGESMILKDGTFIYGDTEGNVPYGHFFTNPDKEYKQTINQLDKLYKSTKDLDYLSDKGIILILLKQYDKAIDLYLEIEKLQPNRYSTASNIGTAYELKGENEKALKWIKRSVEIDPTSHKSSEWIHVNILEAKIKGESFYTSKYLLNTDFGKETLPTTSLSNTELEKLEKALYYQLNERISFVKPKDQIVAQLLFDLGNIAFLRGQYHDAREDYNQARKYGFENNIIEERIRESNRSLKSNKKDTNTEKTQKSNFNYLVFGGASLIFLIPMSIFLYKRKRKEHLN